jgi:hypothetical protein
MNSSNFNVTNVNLRGYKWNETIRNTICSVSNEMCNTRATSYVIADNWRPRAYLILKVMCKWKNKDWSIQKWCLFYSQNNCTLFKQLPKHILIFLILQTFNRLPQLNHKRWIQTYCKWNTLINASFSKMQFVLVRHLWFMSYDDLLVTNMAQFLCLVDDRIL